MQLKQNDHAALDLLFTAYYDALCRYAYTLIDDVDDSEDIVQRCFIKLWEKRESADSILSFKPFLYKSVYNACLHYIEHQKVKQKYKSETAMELNRIYTDSFENTYPQEQLENVKKAIEQLPEKNKEVFKLRFFEGYNTKEVSKKLGITPRTVETHISKALKLLRKSAAFGISFFLLIKILFKHTCL